MTTPVMQAPAKLAAGVPGGMPGKWPSKFAPDFGEREIDASIAA